MATGLGEGDETATGEAIGEGGALWRAASDGLGAALNGEGLAAGFAEAGALAADDVVGLEAAGGAGGA
jgi:hypothetical protein